MADYKFDKPWAADSQNVQNFTKQEWGAGIVEKSLVSSSQVNGVLQEVTSRFLELEAVEDRQFVFDFVVDDDVSWQNFISGNIGTSRSILIRNGRWITDSKITVSSNVNYIQLEANAATNFNGGLAMNKYVSARLAGGRIEGIVNLTNVRAENVNVSSNSISFENSIVTNSFFYGVSGKFAGGLHQNCSLSVANVQSAKFIDCTFESVSQFTNCTLIRCTIPKNTKLANCTLIDCDYTVDTYTANLVTGTTFRNCSLDVQVPNAVLNGNLFANGISNTPCLFLNCKLYFLLPNGNCVKGIARDCEFIATTAGSQSVALMIEGNSSMQIPSLYNENQFENKMRDINKYGIIRTDNPFFRVGSEARRWDLAFSTVIYPGALNILRGNKNLTTFSDNSNYRVKYFFMNSPGTEAVDAGSIIGTSSTFRFIVPVYSSSTRHQPEFSIVL